MIAVINGASLTLARLKATMNGIAEIESKAMPHNPAAPNLGAAFLVALRGHQVVEVDPKAITMVARTAARLKVYRCEPIPKSCWRGPRGTHAYWHRALASPHSVVGEQT